MRYFRDKHGWPVETIRYRGRPVKTFILRWFRRLIHTRSYG